MTELDQEQLGKTLWNIADTLRGAMNADDFRDYMLSFLFLRCLSDNYEAAAKKELRRDYPDPNAIGNRGRTPLSVWYADNPDDVAAFEKQMRRKVHYVIKPEFLWGNIVHLAKTQHEKLLDTLQKGFKFIEEESFSSNLQGLFSEINLASDKLGRKYDDRNAKLCSIISEIARGMSLFSTDVDTLGDAYEYLIGQFAAGAGQEGGRVLHPAADFEHPLRHRHARQPGAQNRHAEEAQHRVRLCLRLRVAAAERAATHDRIGRDHRQDPWPGREHHDLQPRTHEHAAAWGAVPRRG
jgi:type I restriction enzyme M protein